MDVLCNNRVDVRAASPEVRDIVGSLGVKGASFHIPSYFHTALGRLFTRPYQRPYFCTITPTRDSLAIAKVRQAEQANVNRAEEPDWHIGDKVMIDSRDRRLRYKAAKKESRSAKLFARYDGPCIIVEAIPEESRYRLQLSVGDKSFAKFHVSKLKRYVENDNDRFPNQIVPEPEPVIVGGEEEHFVESIIDQKNVGRGIKFLVRWVGYPLVLDSWEPSKLLKDTEALEKWEISRATPAGS